jgi:hypothetical protein
MTLNPVSPFALPSLADAEADAIVEAMNGPDLVWKEPRP